MNVLVTGASGFLGSRLVHRLLKDGHSVAVLIRHGSPLAQLGDLSSQCQLYIYDGSYQSVSAAICEHKPELVYHLASHFLSSHEPEDISNLIMSNILFGTHVLEAMKTAECGGFINAGTSWQHYNNDDYNPVCLYAATKQAFEDVLRYYTDACGIRAITLKLFDTYGDNDPRPKLMNLLMKAAENNTLLEMSPGEQYIDIVHVDDVISAFLKAGDRVVESTSIEPFETFCVSSGQKIMLRDLVALFSRVTGKELRAVFGARPYRQREVMIPWDRGNPVPGWQPSISLEDGIRRLYV